MQEDRIAEVYDGTTGFATLEGYGLGWWVHRDQPGIISDAGAFGATPWLDLERGYGVFLLIEGAAEQGGRGRVRVQALVQEAMDSAE